MLVYITIYTMILNDKKLMNDSYDSYNIPRHSKIFTGGPPVEDMPLPFVSRCIPEEPTPRISTRKSVR